MPIRYSNKNRNGKNGAEQSDKDMEKQLYNKENKNTPGAIFDDHSMKSIR